MPRIEIECRRCGAKYVGASVTEAKDWDTNHDDHCIGNPATSQESES